jgi:hypothetical protein
MHYGSGFGSGFGSGSNIKCNEKVSKNLKMRGQLYEKKAASDIEKARFCAIFMFLENCAKYCLDPEPNFFKVGTGTATTYYGSTTL